MRNNAITGSPEGVVCSQLHDVRINSSVSVLNKVHYCALRKLLLMLMSALSGLVKLIGFNFHEDIRVVPV